MGPDSRRSRWTMWLLAALSVGAALRLFGLGYGLPHVYNPDEVAIMNRAMGLGQNHLNPHNFLYPTLYFYALFAWEGAWFVIGRAIGIFTSLAAFERAFFTDPTSIYLAGRALTVVCGVATIVTTWRLGSRLFGAMAGLVTAIAFVAASPFLLTESGTAVRDIIANRQIVVDRATTSTGAFGSLVFYVRWLVVDGVGLGTSILAAIGLVSLRGRNWRVALIALLFPAVFLLFIANTVPASRYLNPIVPFVALMAGAGSAWLLARQGALRVIGAVLIAAAVVEGVTVSGGIDVFVRQTDTRTQALDWITGNLPAGTSILIQPYSVPLQPSREALAEALAANLGAVSKASVKFQRMLALDPYPAPAYRPIYLGAGGLDAEKIYVAPAAIDRAGSLEPLRRLAVTYVVLKRYNVEDPSMTTLMTALRREARLVATFAPYRPGVSEEQRETVPPFLHNTDARIAPALERPGPSIEIWRID